MVGENEYTLDITAAILSVRKIEGEECCVGFCINPNFEFIRFKPYPYKIPLYKSLLVKYKNPRIALDILYKKRLTDYFEDYIYDYNTT